MRSTNSLHSYNSVVFENKGVTLPDIAFVTEDFFRGGSWLRNPKYDPAACRSNVIDLECFNDELIWLQNLTANNAYQNPKTFKKLSNAECIDTYGQAFTKDVDTLFVVIDSLAASDNNTVYGVSLTTWFSPFSGYFGMLENHKGSQLKNKTSGRSKRMLHYGSSGMPSNGPPSGGYTGTYTGTQTPPLNYTPVEPSVKMTKMGLQTSDWTGNPGVSWICGADDRTKRCNIKEQIKDAATWQIASYPISYCLSKIEPNQRCKLHFSSYILIAVTVANAAKALCMYLAFFRARAEPLVTLGDAIQSFLRDPDPHTKERCLWGKKDFKKYWHTDVDRPADDEAGVMIAEGSPNRWRPSSRFWFRAVSRWYYYIFIIL